jgi:hypothetical protein
MEPAAAIVFGFMKIYEFTFIFEPLQLKRAMGSPGNPIAVR